VAYRIRFSDAAGEHLASLAARDRATLLDRIGRQLTHQPSVETRNRKRMDPDNRSWAGYKAAGGISLEALKRK